MEELEGRVVIVTGGGGALCSGIAAGLAEEGMRIGVLDIDGWKAEESADRIVRDGGQAVPIRADVLNRNELNGAVKCLMDEFGRIDALINGAGGNHPAATTSADRSFFDIPEEAFRSVLELNVLGTMLPCQVIGRCMADVGSGVIINVASVAAFRPLTRVPAYDAAKAAVASFTKWLAVYVSQEISPAIRVNAIAPGFVLAGQNRFLLQDENGELTPRGHRILNATPMGRFGRASDLVGPVVWLVSSAASFVHGVVIPVDGGYCAFSGV